MKSKEEIIKEGFKSVTHREKMEADSVFDLIFSKIQHKGVTYVELAKYLLDKHGRRNSRTVQ